MHVILEVRRKVKVYDVVTSKNIQATRREIRCQQKVHLGRNVCVYTQSDITQPYRSNSLESVGSYDKT